MKKLFSILLAVALIMFMIAPATAQENGMSPIVVGAGVQLQHGHGSEFAVYTGANANLFKVIDSTGKIKGQFFNRTGLFLTESADKPDSANDIKAAQILFGYEAYLSRLFTVGIGGGFLSESKEGEVLIKPPVFAEFGWSPFDQLGIKVGAMYTAQSGGDLHNLYGLLELKPF